MDRKNRFGRSCATFAVVLWASSLPQGARASAYAYASNDIAMSFANATLIPGANGLFPNAFVSAKYSGFGNDLDQDPRDPREVKSGPGPFPAENSFGPQGPVGAYGRADALILAATIGDLRGQNVGEAFRTSGGSASGFAQMSFDFGLAQTGAAPIAISLFAAPSLRVDTTGPGDHAAASVNYSVTFLNRGTNNVLFQWTPNGTVTDFVRNAGVVTNVTDPFDLQRALDCTGVCTASYAQAGTFHIEYALAAGQEYDVRIRWAEDAVAEVPEPSTVLLGLVALLAMAGASRVRAARRRPGAPRSS